MVGLTAAKRTGNFLELLVVHYERQQHIERVERELQQRQLEQQQ